MSSVIVFKDVSRFEGLHARFRAAIDRLLELDQEFQLEPGPELGFVKRLFAAWRDLKDPAHASSVDALWAALDWFDAEVELAECELDRLEAQLRSCDCRTKPMEDPAVAVGLVLHYARTAITRGLPIPPSVIELLTHHVEEGDPTCIVVARWLDENGLLDIACKNNDAVGRVQ